MSVNKYDSTTGTLTTLATGDRTWVGTKAAYEAQKQAGTLPNDCIVCITDDEVEMDTVPTKDSPVAVTSGGLYDILAGSSLKDTNIKWIYMENNNIVTLSDNTFLIFAVKPQWGKQAIFSFSAAYDIATFVNVGDLSITRTVNPDNSIQLVFGDTYMQLVVVARRDFTYTISKN